MLRVGRFWTTGCGIRLAHGATSIDRSLLLLSLSAAPSRLQVA